MKRKFKLQKIRRIRSLRDKAMASDNEGYIRNCIAKFPEVVSVSTQSGWSSYSKARMSDGYEFLETWRYHTLEYRQLHKIVNDIYKYIIEHFI